MSYVVVVEACWNSKKIHVLTENTQINNTETELTKIQLKLTLSKKRRKRFRQKALAT
jgi:hypothetical protein